MDTRGKALSQAGVDAGNILYCICPNGRAMRNYDLPNRDPIETNISAVHAALVEDGLDAQLYLQGSLSTVCLEHDCQKFNISVDLTRAAVEVEAGERKAVYGSVRADRMGTFLLADPDVFAQIVAYIKSYRPPKGGIFEYSVSEKIDRAQPKRRRTPK